MDRCHVEIWIIRYNKALAASVRVPEDALLHEGLLPRAVRQLVLNWEHTGSARQEVLAWCGALLQRIHVVWPQFRMQLLDRLSWTGTHSGTPSGALSESISRRVTGAPVAIEAVRRLVSTPATDSAGPYSLPHTPSIWLGATTGQRNWTYCDCAARYITQPDLCTVSWGQYRCVQSNVENHRGHGRFRAYECTFFWWDTHPTLRHSACERLCSHCLLYSLDQRLDSELHAYLDCPLTEKARREYVLLTKLEAFFMVQGQLNG